jgi:hypothetical protein
MSKLDADLNALVAANPTATTLQSDVAKTQTELTGCITRLQNDANSVEADVTKLENDLGGQPAVTGTFTDLIFNDGDWQNHDLLFGNGGSTTIGQLTSGGDIGSFRQVTIDLAAPTAGSGAEVITINIKPAAAWDPSTSVQGPISTIDYSEYSRLIVGSGEGQATGAALLQNGHYYIALLPQVFTPETIWTRKMQTGLQASSFTEIGTGNHPDFTSSGASIEFGFFRANSAPAGAGGAGHQVVGIDNWAITVHT